MATKDRSPKDLTRTERERTEQVRETKKELRNEDPITGSAGSSCGSFGFLLQQ